MNFTKSELETLCQYAAPTKEETLAGLKEIVPVLEKKDDLLSKVIVENTIRKLEKLTEPECSQFIADNRAAFIEKHDNSIRQRLAAAKAGKGEPVLLGHDLAGMERFLPETRHMVTVDILNSDSPVGFPYALTLQKVKKLLSGMFSFFNKRYLHQFQNVKAHRLYIR